MTIETNSQEFKAVCALVRETTITEISKRPLAKWITQEEVEKIYGIKHTQLYELRESAIFKEKKVGSKVLISVSSIEKFMEGE